MTSASIRSLAERALLLLAATATNAAAAPRPNLVLIFTDDQQQRALGAGGNAMIVTPTMDWIAQRGVLFTQARAALPVCSPSRAAIVTGQFASANGVEDLGDELNPESPRLAVELRRAGYATAVVGKWHLGRELDQADLGFEYFATYHANGDYYRRYRDFSDSGVPKKPEHQHIDAYASDRSCEFIDSSLDRGKPFFLWHCTQTPHLNGDLKWDARPESRARYSASDFYEPGAGVNRLPGNWNDSLDGKPAYYKGIRNRTLAQKDRRYRYGDPERLAQHTSEYYAVITELDQMLKPLLDKLRSTPDPRNGGRPLLENTYVFFMADNGWLMGDHGMTSKSLPFDQSARVPFAVLGPGVDVGRVDDRQVSNLDLAPTLLDLAGAEAPGAMHGESIQSMLSDDGLGPPVRRISVVEIWESTFARNKPLLAAYDGRFELIYTYDDEPAATPSFVEAYDLQSDPWELDNLTTSPIAEQAVSDALLGLHKELQAHRNTVLGLPAHAMPAPLDQSPR